MAISVQRAISKTNLIEFTNNGDQTHTFRSKKVRKIIDRIIVNDSGAGYDKHQISVRSNSYPVNSPIEIYSGVKTENNYIYAKNHNLKNGDILEYIPESTVISGLNTITQYKVTKISDDKFKLSDKGPDEDTNYAIGFSFGGVNGEISHTYVSGATEWQQVDDYSSVASFIRINFNR